jgi:hypothetical protein
VAGVLVWLLTWLPALSVLRAPVGLDRPVEPPSRQAARQAAQPSVGLSDRSWEVGDAFDVVYTVSTLRALQRPGGPVPGEPLRRTWRYTIIEEKTVDGRARRTLRAVPLPATAGTGEDGRGNLHARGQSDAAAALAAAITLTVDVDTRALIQLSEAVSGMPPGQGGSVGAGAGAGLPSAAQVVHHPNRYAVGGPEAMLFPVRLFTTHIADLPRLSAEAADPGAARSRIIERTDGLLPAFEQRLSALAEGGWEVELLRQEPDSGRELRVWQRWPAGGLWWSAARVTLGDELLIEGRWLGVAKSGELWLPRLLNGELRP